MTQDEFGGVLVDAPATDEFGGVLVHDPTPQRDEFGGVAIDDAPDEYFVGQEVRGVGRALHRGVLAADQAASVIAAEAGALGANNDVTDLNRLQGELDQFDAQAATNPAFASTPQSQAWRQNREGQIGALKAELDRKLPMIPQSLERIARREQQIRALPGSPDLANLHTDFWSTFASNPVETIATTVAESLPQAAAGMVLGAASGGPVGMAVASGANSLGVEYANSLLDTARGDGVDVGDPQALVEFFGNADKMAAARVKAVERGMPVAAFDAATAGLAGRFLKPVLGRGTRQVLTASAKELGMQMGGGMAGEAGGQLASEGEITSVPDIMLEGIAELGTAPGEVFGNLRESRDHALGSGSHAAAAPVLPDLENELPPPMAAEVPGPVQTPGPELPAVVDENAVPAAADSGAAAVPLESSSSALGAAPQESVTGAVAEDAPPESGAEPKAPDPNSLTVEDQVAAPAPEIPDTQAAIADSDPSPEPQQDRVEAALDWLKIDTAGKVYDVTSGLPVAVWNGLIEAVRVAYKAGRSLTEAASAGVQWLRDNQHPFDEAKVLAAIDAHLGVRAFGDQIDASADINDPVKVGVENRLYTKAPNETSAAAAGRIIKAVGGSIEAIAVFSDPVNGLDGATRSMLGQLVVKQMAEQERTLRGQGDTAAADQLATRQIRFIDDTLLPATTDLAQALQALAAFQFMTPQGIVRYARRQIENGRNGLGARIRPSTDAVVDALGKINGEAIDAAASTPVAQAAARKAGDSAVDGEADREGSALRDALTLEVTNSLDLMAGARAQRKAIAMRALQTLGRDTYWGRIVNTSAKALENRIAQLLGPSNSKALTVSSVASDVTKALSEQLRGTLNLQPGETLPTATYFQRLKSILSNRQQMDEIWSAARAMLLEKYDGDVAMMTALSQDFSAWGPGLLRGLVDEHLAQLDVGLRELTAQHYRLKDGHLRDKLVAMLGVDPETATRLARELDGMFAVEYGKARIALKARTAAVRKDALLMRAARSGVVDLAALPNGEVDKAIAARLTQTRTQLGRLVREHFTKVQAAGRTLAETLATEAGLTPAASKEFAASIERRFAQVADERKRREVKRIEDLTPSTPHKVKQGWQRLVELSNLGALDSAKAWATMQEKLDLPTWTTDLAKEVNRRADEIQQAPEGRPRDRKIAELMNYLAQSKGVSWWDLGMSAWYANTLSGPLTHVANLAGNVLNLGLNVAIAVRRPTTWAAQMAALGRGLQTGGDAAAEIMRTGLVIGRSDKFKASNALEVWRLNGNLDYLLTPWRAVGRALAAGDAVFYHGAHAMRASLLAQMVAKQEGFEGRTARRRALEIIGQVPKRKAEAEAQVAREGLSGRAARLRTAELLERDLPERVRVGSREFALRVTYNQTPYGLLGVVAQGVNWAAERAPVLRFVVPFTNIVANVANESLNYLPPVGAGRALWGHWKGELEGKPITTREDLYDQWAKAALGTALLSTLFAAAEGGLDDPGAWFSISGSGPRSKAQRDQLRAQGWRPNTLRFGDRYVSFANTPLAIPLAVMGNWFDARKFKHLDTQDALNRAAYLFANLGDVILQQSFLSGISGLVRFLDKDNMNRGADFVRSMGGTASNFIVPNALRFVDRVFDPTVYDAKAAEAALAQSIPFVRREGRPALNVWGDPVRSQVTDRFTTERQLDPALDLLARRGMWISVPSQANTMLAGKPMTDDEFYEFVRVRGQDMKKTLANPDLRAALASMPDKNAGKLLERIERKAGIVARGAVLRQRQNP